MSQPQLNVIRDLRLEKIQRPEGQATLMSVMATIRSGGLRRGYVWQLNFEQFKTIATKNCFYCDIQPPLKNKYCSSSGVLHEGHARHGYRQPAIDRSWVAVHGLDRVDNEKGYTENNSVACCNICNKMKTILTIEEFFAHIARILARKEVILDTPEVKRVGLCTAD